MFYINDEIQDLIEKVNSDNTLKRKILSYFEGQDLYAMEDVLDDGCCERFDRYDSDVCEQFLTAWEKER